MLPTIYVSINHGQLNVIHNINQIITAILKSHPHNHAQPDITICIKKNINIIRTQTTQLSIATSDRSIHVYVLNK
jgi:hypothetical protein